MIQQPNQAMIDALRTQDTGFGPQAFMQNMPQGQMLGKMEDGPLGLQAAQKVMEDGPLAFQAAKKLGIEGPMIMQLGKMFGG